MLSQSGAGTQGFNRYAYANNNPVTYADPSGYAAGLAGLGQAVAGVFGYIAAVLDCYLHGECRYARRHAESSGAPSVATAQSLGYRCQELASVASPLVGVSCADQLATAATDWPVRPVPADDAGVTGGNFKFGFDLSLAPGMVGCAGRRCQTPLQGGSGGGGGTGGSGGAGGAGPRLPLPPGNPPGIGTPGAIIRGLTPRANFAQRTYRETFSDRGQFSGQTVGGVANNLRAGVLTPDDIPIHIIVRGSNVLILNTRSSQALIRGGIPRSEWRVHNVTGQPTHERRLDAQLSGNGLTEAGIETVSVAAVGVVVVVEDWEDWWGD